MATPTISLAQFSRIAGGGTLAVDPQGVCPAKTPVIKCCQCESVASSQFQLAFQLFNLSTFQLGLTLATRVTIALDLPRTCRCGRIECRKTTMRMTTEKQAKTTEGAALGRVVLVGACRGDQLKCCQCESVASGQSQLPIKAMGKLATGNWNW
jgi:hypothetical protein